MTEPVCISVTVLDADTEISAMHALSQVMRHMVDYESMTERERHRIATWFASRYGAMQPTTGKEGA